MANSNSVVEGESEMILRGGRFNAIERSSRSITTTSVAKGKLSHESLEAVLSDKRLMLSGGSEIVAASGWQPIAMPTIQLITLMVRIFTRFCSANLLVLWIALAKVHGCILDTIHVGTRDSWVMLDEG